MKRRILIITNPGVVGSSTYCEGVNKDRENYLSFFKSAIGGYYSESEIRLLDKQSVLRIREELRLLQSDIIDFSIIIFCGHGWYSTTNETNILCINDNEQFDSIEFRRNYKKRIIIEDNCREKHAEYIFDSLQKSINAIHFFGEGGKIINPEQCKYYYNKRIEECPEQLIYSTGCNIGETAGDSSSKGGYYSSSLLKETRGMVENALKITDISKVYKIFNFPACHDSAVPKVRTLSDNKQNPQIEKPRFSNNLSHLPFAVIA